MPDFCHLHCHTQYSLLDGASEIGTMMDKAVADGQTAVALTDHGNMYGAFKFVAEANKRDIKPIIGCEFYLVENRHKRSFEKKKGEKDKRYHQLLLAKNKKGYHNLAKMCSLGFIEGLYGKFPRIDKELIEKYHEGVIATSCCLGAEIPQAILHGDHEKAEKMLKWWVDIFGEDYYIELQRHRGLENIDGTGVSQEDINQVLLRLAKKYNVKTIVTNDSHYVEEEDFQPHDVLLCVNTGSLITDEKRFSFPSSDFYFKTKEEMNTIFGDVAEAVDNTMEIASKIEPIKLARDILLPAFPLPAEFSNQDDYLKFLTFEGARKKYGMITAEIEERILFELSVISNSGYPGYFLIVQDFTTVAREMGVSVGPGRGSAAGSVVAYALGITNIDPIKYDLLFERFLNPERVSMPDIDIDFDDEGREKVINYVIDKYGKNQVAQIITYGTMAAKMSLRDVGRVMDVPLYEVNNVSNVFPKNLSATLNGVLQEGDVSDKLKDKFNSEELAQAYEFRKLAEQQNDIGEMIRTAKKLEGSIRSTGIHACGVIITPNDITDVIPVTVAKDSDLLVSQFDNSVAEDAGLLKMDFLGLKTLTIIKDAVKFAEENYGVKIDIENVDLEDEKTYELFQRGDTIGIFQYESQGMQKNLKELAPNKFEDLIAMNALYRPGPMQYIPNFVNRKHGREEISYDLDDMAEYLEETYGITVYQEQVMLLSQKLAGFTKGEADMLRKAMGKKKKKVIDQMWPKFLEGCNAKGYPEKIVKKIWSDWEKFASYAFNKSHSTCYAFLAFQTAYLKAHYPVAFLASVLNHNKSDITKLNFFLREGKRMGIDILGPDINDSREEFSINKDKQIRFGLTALKGVGEGPVSAILEAREDGEFEDMFDLVRRVNLRAFNKRCFESVVKGGGLDSLINELPRSTFYAPSSNYSTFMEHLIKYGALYQNQEANAQATLFGEAGVEIDLPKVPEVEEWGSLEKLENEKEVTGIYLSGHPLDDYQHEFKHFINCPLSAAENIKDKPLKVAGIVTNAMHGVSKRGTGYVRFTLQDFNGSLELGLYNEDYNTYRHLVENGQILYLEIINAKRYNSDSYFTKVKNIKLLNSIGKSMTKGLVVKLPIQRLDEVMLHEIITVCEENVGIHEFKLRVIDLEEEEIDLELKPNIIKIDVNYEVINAFDRLNLPHKVLK